jgi:hypothetical protein
MRAILMMVLMLAGCAVEAGEDLAPVSCPVLPCLADEAPTCAELGCPFAPSGSPEQWTPCADDLCWCGSPAVQCVP